MQNTSSFVPREGTFLDIKVIPNDADQTFETNLHCALNHCGKIVCIDSHGRTSTQKVSCPKHGFLAAFPDQIALSEFIRFVANKILTASGHQPIEPGAAWIFTDDEPFPKSVN
jgi:hypothetical protein